MEEINDLVNIGEISRFKVLVLRWLDSNNKDNLNLSQEIYPKFNSIQEKDLFSPQDFYKEKIFSILDIISQHQKETIYLPILIEINPTFEKYFELYYSSLYNQDEIFDN